MVLIYKKKIYLEFGTYKKKIYLEFGSNDGIDVNDSLCLRNELVLSPLQPLPFIHGHAIVHKITRIAFILH